MNTDRYGKTTPNISASSAGKSRPAMRETETTLIVLLCDKFIEAGWLAAVFLTAFYMNIYTHRMFEPDKACVLRSLVLLMLVAWFIKGLELRRINLSEIIQVVSPGLVWGIMQLVASIAHYDLPERTDGIFMGLLVVTLLVYIVIKHKELFSFKHSVLIAVFIFISES